MTVIKQVVELPIEEFQALKANQELIIGALKDFKVLKQTEYLTAQEFMDAVKIKRWKFNQLKDNNQIRVIQKSRKIYIPHSEVRRYFEEVGQ